MPSGAGLDAQLGVGIESTWGTAVTATKFFEFLSESLNMTPTYLDSAGLRAGQRYKRVSRTIISRKTVAGDVQLEHGTKSMGLLWKHSLGSAIATPTLLVTPAYEQVHTPGDFRSLGLTFQVGRPEPASAVVRPFTYAGCKVQEWEFSVSDGDIPSLQLTLDGRSEDTAAALATASYPAGVGVFSFANAALKLGGTAATAAGKTTITGGVQATTIISSMTVHGSTPMSSERFGIGNAGLKGQQIENDTPTITGSFAAEFNKAELYDAFASNATTAVQMILTGSPIAASGSSETLEITMPAVKFTSASPQVGGPDLVQMTTEFEAYSDDVNPVIQVRLISTDAAL
jgi:hypothetical protein